MKSGPRWEQLGRKKKEISKTRSRENFLFNALQKSFDHGGIIQFFRHTSIVDWNVFEISARLILYCTND
jgi:hypothetical protein